jgi:hypothetical protein
MYRRDCEAERLWFATQVARQRIKTRRSLQLFRRFRNPLLVNVSAKIGRVGI